MEELISIDLDWLDEWDYSSDDFKVGDHWLWAINPQGEIVYFEKVDYKPHIDEMPQGEDRVYLVRIERLFPTLMLEVLERWQ